MFSALRQNSFIYILDKTSEPMLKKVQVSSITSPRPRANAIYGLSSNMVVDIEVNIDGSKQLFKDIPSNLSLVNDGNIILSESRDAMSNEIEALYSNSKQIVESCEYHKKSMELYEEMLQLLNPLLAREKEHESKITLLESKVTGIESSLTEIKSMLSLAFKQTMITK